MAPEVQRLPETVRTYKATLDGEPYENTFTEAEANAEDADHYPSREEREGRDHAGNA
jgi:hypothetical protein